MKNIAWTSQELGVALNIDIPQSFVANRVEFNSRDIIPGDIFVALPGGQRDANQFIDDALKKGAVLAIANEKARRNPKVVNVKDPFAALKKLAEYKRKNSKAKFIGITGSVGKTSTKESTVSMLSEFAATFSSKGNFNNHIGVPLTLASLSNDAVYSVNEMGMNHAGEIRELTKIVKPHIAIITKIGPAHLEFFDSVADICRAKCEIFEGLDKEGVAIINKDCEFYNLQAEILNNLGIKDIYSFGENEKTDCRLVEYENYGEYSKLKYQILGKEYITKSYLLGKHQYVNLSASLLTSLALGLDVEKAVYSIENIKPFHGRGVIHKINLSQNTFATIIDDAYNANPLSMKAALEALSEKDGEKIAILAEMKELGPNAAKLHAELIESVIKSGVTTLITVGGLMKNLHNVAKGNIVNNLYFDEVNLDTFEEIFELIKPTNSTILVKGSNSTGIGRILNFFKNKSNFINSFE